MFSAEQRRIATETFIRFDHSYADTIAEPGYPTRHPLRAWHKDYLEHGEARPPERQREPKFTLEMRQAAVGCCLAHGKSLARTMCRMGYPASRECLCDWAGIALEEFMDMPDAYLRWYGDARIKGDLDYRSPMQYRRDLGLAA